MSLIIPDKDRFLSFHMQICIKTPKSVQNIFSPTNTGLLSRTKVIIVAHLKSTKLCRYWETELFNFCIVARTTWLPVSQKY